MRILQFISSSGFYGAENVVLQLALSLEKLGVEPIVGVVRNTHNPRLELLEKSRQHGINATSFVCRGKIDYQLVRRLREFIVAEQVDVVHSHGYKSNFYAYVSSLGLPVSLVSTCHNWIDNEYKMKIYSKLDRFILRRFSHVVAVSSQVVEQLLINKVSPEKVQKINNGIDVSMFYGTAPESGLERGFGINAKDVVVGTVGRISEEKGHRFLLGAFNVVKNSFPGLRLLIVGDGPLKTALEREFSDHDIIFTGNRHDVPEMYRLMDIFVLPSLTEGLPMVLLEAMASGKAVVATRVGEIPSVVSEGKSGLLVNPGSEKELSKALETLLSSPMFAGVLGVEASKLVNEKYSSMLMTQAYLKVYEKVVQQKSQGNNNKV